MIRCGWADKPELMTKYHDEEWGVPLWDDARLFEFLVLETFQAGLSWLVVLRRRELMREALDGFDPARIAAYDDTRIDTLVEDARVIRHRKKLEAARTNAAAFLALQARHGTFAKYMWDFVDGEPIVNHWRTMSEIPAKTPVAETIAKDLRRHGFKFIGPTVVYAHMQATGMVNDHLVDCFRRAS